MENRIKLLVGLGNPGPQYAKTRHNVGFWLLEELAARYQQVFRPEAKFQGSMAGITLAEQRCDLLLPQTFMNLSGSAVSKVAKFYKIACESILVVHDELDFFPGVVRLKNGGGANGHNGVQSIIDCLGSGEFWRLRIGIGKPQTNKERGSNYVLASPTQAETEQIYNAIDDAIRVMPQIISGDFAAAMTALHNAT